MMEQAHLRPAQASEYLGISVGSLANWRVKRVGPAFSKIGNLILYSKGDLDSWVARGKQSTEIAT